MKKIFTFCLLVFLSITSLNAQNWRTPLQAGGSYTPEALKTVYFVSATQGWVVGSGGVIVTTNNGGATWTAQNSGTTESLYNIFFINATQGWAVGSGGIIVTTNNGGNTWTTQTSGVTGFLSSIFFTSATQGWVVGGGGVILTTNNGGSTWTAQTTGTFQTFNSVHFISATQGWAVGDNATILTTSNGGITWTTQTLPTIQGLYSVYFISPTQGWIVGTAGTILTTINGGASWTAQTSGTTNNIFSVFFASTTQGWAVAGDGVILTTSNGGDSWTAQSSGTSNILLSVFFTSATDGWVVGNAGTILTTNNGGSTWTAQTLGTTNQLYSVYFTSATQGWSVGIFGTILTTNNGGGNWTAQTSGTTDFLRSVFFTSATQGWTVGTSGTILTTNDGGNIWTAQTSGTTNQLSSVFFISATQGWAVGVNGTILTTNNGGNIWTAQTSGTTNQLYSVYFTSATKGWAVGFAGIILTTNDGGNTWTAQTSNATRTLNSVYFISATQGWAVGINGTITSTTDGGSTWTAQKSGIANFIGLNSVYFTSATQGWAVGGSNQPGFPPSGTIITTSNGGSTWTAQTSPTIYQLNSVFFSSATQGWAVGNLGRILIDGNICTPTSSRFTTAACGSYTWVAKGNKVYTASNNTDTIHLTNAGGCDSLVTLDLTISAAPVNQTVDLSDCKSVVYNGVTYTQNATVYDTIKNGNGCDSIYRTVNVRVGFQAIISVDKNPTCNTQIATFTSKVYNGNLLVYQWYKNGVAIVGATTASYITAGTIVGDDIQLRVRSKSPLCSSNANDTVWSNVIHFAGMSSAASKLTISTPSTSVCTGASVTYTATATNAGSMAVYTWKVNGATVAQGKDTFYTSTTIANGDVVSCTLNTNNVCQVTNVINSNTITMTVNATTSVPVNAITGNTGICSIGGTTTLTETTVGGAWSSSDTKVATVNASGVVTATGTGTTTIKYTVGTGVCGTNASVDVAVAPIKMLPITGPTTVCQGNSVQLANATVGKGVWSVVNARGTITPGGLLKGTAAGGNAIVQFAVTNGAGCSSKAYLNVAVTAPCALPKELPKALEVTQITKLSIYPNPARGVVTIDNGQLKLDNAKLMITDMAGKILKTQNVTDKQTKVNISGLKPGMYLVTMQSAEGKTTEKLMVE